MEQQENTQQKPTMSKKKKIIIGIIIGIIAIGIIGGIAGGTSDSTDDSTTTTETTDDSPQIIDVNVGDEFTFDGLKIKVESWKVESFLNGYYDAGENNKWVNVKMSITNPNSTSVDLKDAMLSYEYAVYSTWIEYNSSVKYNETYYTNNDVFIAYYDSILPLGTVSGIQGFKVPQVVADSTESLSFNFTFNKIADRETIIRVWLRK